MSVGPATCRVGVGLRSNRALLRTNAAKVGVARARGVRGSLNGGANAPLVSVQAFAAERDC